MVLNGPKWFKMYKMVKNGRNAQKLPKNGAKWSEMVQNGPKWSKMVQMIKNGGPDLN